MEPTHLNSPDDPQLEAFLKQPLPPLADAGFSVRTVRALPSFPEEKLRRLRWLCVGLGLVIGVAISFVGVDWSALHEYASANFTQSIYGAADLMLDPRFLVGASVGLGSLLYALLSNGGSVTLNE